MKKISLSIATALVFFVAAAVAQYAPRSDSQSQGTQSSSPAAQQGSSASPSSMQQGTEAKGEKELKGCIKSENGKFALEEKRGKTIELTGQDVSAHVGHEVAVHGSYESASAATASGTSASAKAGKAFNVTSVDMISESCGGKKSSTKSPSQQPQ